MPEVRGEPIKQLREPIVHCHHIIVADSTGHILEQLDNITHKPGDLLSEVHKSVYPWLLAALKGAGHSGELMCAQ